MSNAILSFRDRIPQLGYRLLSYDKSKYEGDWKGIAHSHPYSEIIIVTGGEGCFAGGDEKRRIASGSVILTNPYVSHTEYSQPPPSAPLEYTAIALDGVCFSDGADEQLFARGYVFDFGGRFRELKAVLGKIDGEIAEKKPYWQTAVLSCVNELLIMILRCTGLNNVSVKEELPPKASKQPLWFVKRYLELYFIKNITLDELSEKFFINKYYLIRAFKQTYGKTPMQYLQEIRINQAKELLVNTDMSITQIAAQMGFASASHLAQVFRRYTGKTPSAFAKAHEKAAH